MSTSSFYNTTGPDSSQVTAIEGSVSSAADSAAAAEAAKVAAQSSASQAAASSNANATSAAASEASKVASQVAENNAETAETNSAASAAAALVSKNSSAASAVASEASKVTSVNSASTSTTKAAEASTSETNAAASAATATSKASDSETARAASVVAKDASVVAKNESVSARDASVAAKNASVAAQAAAETAETNTETAETNSASSASAASASAATASTKASEASTSAAASETSKVASEAAKDAALAALDSFDDRYLGSSANSPTVDNDGDALAAGMLYFNTTTDEMKVYDGSQWLNAYASLSGALLATGNLSDLNNAATARANLGLGTAATTPSTDYATAAQGTKVDGIEASADVTDTTNVTAAGALMDSEVTNLAQVKAFDSADYATAAQGTTADAALPRTGGAMTGAITTNSTFDGRDVATDGTKLDGIEASADVTDTANVTAAGALMDSELTSIASVKALNQGVATTDSPDFAALNVNGTATMDGLTVDGTAEVSLTDSDYFKINHQTRGGDYRVTTSGISAETLTLRNGASQILTAFASNGDISFYEDTGTTAKFFWDASAERLGIGTSNPDTSLHVTTPSGTKTELNLAQTAVTNYRLSIPASTDALTFVYGANTERMRIDASGNVGINTSSPAATLHTVANSGTTGFLLTGAASNNIASFYTSGGSQAMTLDSSGNVGIGCTPSPWGFSKALQLGDGASLATGGNQNMWLSSNLYLGTDANFKYVTSRNASQINLYNGGVVFQRAATGTAGATATLQESMRIDSSGNVLFGKSTAGITTEGFAVFGNTTAGVTSSITSLSHNTYHVYRSGPTDGGYKFYVNANGGIKNFSANNVNLSDEREKKNIEPLESQWDSLKQWSLKKFHYNTDGDSDNKKLGVIAQEVETHNPEVIDEFNVDDKTTRMAVKEQQMMWMAIKALQEAQTRIETLEARVTELENN